MTDQHPMMRFEDIPNFPVGALVMEYSKEELRQMTAALRTSDAMLESEKDMALSQLERDIEAATAGSDEPDPGPETEEPGKADEPSPISDDATG